MRSDDATENPATDHPRPEPPRAPRPAPAISALVTIALGLAWPGCGGSDVQPDMPDPTVVDPPVEDLDLPEASESSGGEDGAAASEGEPPAEPPPAEARVIEGERTAIEGASPRIRILSPRSGQRIRSGHVSLRIGLRGWTLAPAPGQHVHVIVDDEPYIAVRDVSSPIDLNALVESNLGHELAEGTHVLRAFPSRGHHESVKTDHAFATVTFHYRSRTEGFAFDPSAPFLTYSRPKGCAPPGERILLDFYVRNTELSAEGNRVRYSIDGVAGEITRWVPHWIENLAPGEHRIQLQLTSADGEVLPGPFNDTTRTIRVGGCS